MAMIPQPLREALIRISKDPTLVPFLNYLAAEITKDTASMTTLDVPMVYRAQGRVGALTDLKNLIEAAETLPVKNEPRVVKTAGVF